MTQRATASVRRHTGAAGSAGATPRSAASSFRCCSSPRSSRSVAFLVHNTMDNLRRQNIATGFGFLDREAAFGIGETLIAYSPADTYARAFLVGLPTRFTSPRSASCWRRSSAP